MTFISGRWGMVPGEKVTRVLPADCRTSVAMGLASRKFDRITTDAQLLPRLKNLGLA